MWCKLHDFVVATCKTACGQKQKSNNQLCLALSVKLALKMNLADSLWTA